MDAEATRAGSIHGFHVVALGIRANETRPDLVAPNDRGLHFAGVGGNGGDTVQQVRISPGFAPYPVAYSPFANLVSLKGEGCRGR